MRDPIIETQDLTFRYSGNDSPSLDGVSVRIRRGVRTVILGANGAGKSTLFYHFNGLFRPSSGRVLFDGEPPHCSTISTACSGRAPAASSSTGSRSDTDAKVSGS